MLELSRRGSKHSDCRHPKSGHCAKLVSAPGNMSRLLACLQCYTVLTFVDFPTPCFSSLAEQLSQRWRPPNAGKNPDLALYALDAVGSHIDPAFDAHILPLKQWATAWWESWIDHAVLFQAWEAAERRLHERSSSVWRKVTGPVAATIATAQRLGWKLIDGRVFVDDAGQSFDCLLGSPAAITAAITRSVRRWQINRVARELPSGRPLFCDLCSPSADDGYHSP